MCSYRQSGGNPQDGSVGKVLGKESTWKAKLKKNQTQLGDVSKEILSKFIFLRNK